MGQVVHAGSAVPFAVDVGGYVRAPIALTHDGGIVAMKATCSNQDGEVVAEATGTMLVKNA